MAESGLGSTNSSDTSRKALGLMLKVLVCLSNSADLASKMSTSSQGYTVPVFLNRLVSEILTSAARGGEHTSRKRLEKGWRASRLSVLESIETNNILLTLLFSCHRWPKHRLECDQSHFVFLRGTHGLAVLPGGRGCSIVDFRFYGPKWFCSDSPDDSRYGTQVLLAEVQWIRSNSHYLTVAFECSSWLSFHSRDSLQSQVSPALFFLDILQSFLPISKEYESNCSELFEFFESIARYGALFLNVYFAALFLNVYFAYFAIYI